MASIPTRCGGLWQGVRAPKPSARLAVAVALAAPAAVGAAAARTSARFTRMRWISLPAKRSK
eukprot:1407531-Prymnesium_polylepis.1